MCLEGFFHIKNNQTDCVISNKWQSDHKQTDQNCEQHLILLSLLDALFPDVELQTSLFAITRVSKGLNVGNESIIDTFDVWRIHEEETLECLTQAESWRINRVTTFIDQVEDFNNDWIFEKAFHPHFKHHIKRVLSFSHVEDWFSHESIQLWDVMLLLKIAFQTLMDVSVQQRTLCNQRVDLLLLDFPWDSVNQQGVLDGVELIQHGVHLQLLSVQDELVTIN